MNTISKILFWTMTIALGFVNPLISVILAILYYLPKIIPIPSSITMKKIPTIKNMMTIAPKFPFVFSDAINHTPHQD